MSKTLEAIKNGQEVEMQEVFELVNNFNITSLNVQDGDHTALKMQVNHFESYRDVYEFSQEHTDENMYIINQSDILSVDVRWEKEIDSVIVVCQMTNNKKMNLVIYYVSEDFSISESDEYEEIDLSYLEKFLDDALKENGEYYCALVRAIDKFSVFLKMTSPQRAYIDTLDDSNWKLHISDNISEFVISVMEDGCNAFYYKETDTSVEIAIKPYGQPFMEVRMLFFKRNK